MKNDGFVKSPSAALRGNFVVAAHLYVRLTPRFLRALHLELLTKPSSVVFLQDHQESRRQKFDCSEVSFRV